MRRKNLAKRSYPKKQYDDLFLKYEESLKKYKILENKLKNYDKTLNLNAIQKQKLREELAPAPTEMPKIWRGKNTAQIDGLLESEIDDLLVGKSSLKKKDFNGAIKIFQKLENSKFHQIRVRAKYQIGKLLFEQQEYDLAMQVFEEIVKSHSYSGIALMAVEDVIKCAEKLKLQDVLDTYKNFNHKYFKES